MQLETLPVEKPRRKLKFLDIIIGIIVIVVCVVLARTLLLQLSIKNEVKGATAVTNRVIEDIATNKPADIRSLGDSSFQRTHSTTELGQILTAAKTYTKGTPTIDRKTITNTDESQAVSVIYKYPNTPPFFIRVIVVKAKGSDTWKVVNLSGNQVESKLLNNKY